MNLVDYGRRNITTELYYFLNPVQEQHELQEQGYPQKMRL